MRVVAHEHAVTEADNHGYLWRLNSYWRFVKVSRRGDRAMRGDFTDAQRAYRDSGG